MHRPSYRARRTGQNDQQLLQNVAEITFEMKQELWVNEQHEGL
jgi:hypothetical protein